MGFSERNEGIRTKIRYSQTKHSNEIQGFSSETCIEKNESSHIPTEDPFTHPRLRISDKNSIDYNGII